MDTAWTWELPGFCAKYSFLTEPQGLTMREVERIFQLDPEPPVLENMNDYIIEAVRSRELRWFSFFLHCYENRLNGRVRRFLLREGLDYIERNGGELLSSFEQKVWDLYLKGVSYTEIAKLTNKTPKAVDNAITRAKRKLEPMLSR